MKRTMLNAIIAAALTAGLATAQPLLAQSSPGYEKTQQLTRYQEMSEIMRDMSQEMSRMKDRMAKGEMTPEEHRQMSQRIKLMSAVMRQMSGLLDRPSMRDAEMKKQMGQMRKQMDVTKADAPTAPAKK